MKTIKQELKQVLENKLIQTKKELDQELERIKKEKNHNGKDIDLENKMYKIDFLLFHFSELNEEKLLDQFTEFLIKKYPCLS
jgi:hypothetical protein